MYIFNTLQYKVARISKYFNSDLKIPYTKEDKMSKKAYL